MRLKTISLAVALLGANIPSATLRAANVTWDNGASSILWTDAINWDPADTLPGVDDTAIIGGFSPDAIDATGAPAIDALRLTRSVTLNNDTITMDATANQAGSSGIYQSDLNGSIATINSNLLFTGTTTTGVFPMLRVQSNGTTTINGTVTNAGNLGQPGAQFLDFSGAAGVTGATLIFNGPITTVRTTGHTELVVNRGTVELNAGNSWTNAGSLRLNTQVSNGTGTLKLGHGSALGNSNFSIGGGDGSIGTSSWVGQVLQTGPNTIANNIEIRNSAFVSILGADIAGDTATYTGAIRLNTVASGTAGTVNFRSVQADGTVDFRGVISSNLGNPLLRDVTIGDPFAGPGTVRFSANNTYPGRTTILGGTLSLSGDGSLAGTSAVEVNGATLILSTPERIGDLTPFTTGGGAKIELNGGSDFLETLGPLSLSSGNTVIDFGTMTGINTLSFAASAFTGDGTLQVWNWSGTPGTGGGTDQLYFGTTGTSLTGGTSAMVEFFTGPGTGSLGFGTQRSTGELVPPAPSSTPYSAWASGFPGFTPTSPQLDFDNDGLPNLLEFVLGGDPRVSGSPAIRPIVGSAGTNLTVTFVRADASKSAPAVVVKVQVSSTTAAWNPADDIVIGPVSGTVPNGASYTVIENGAAPDTITVTIPYGSAPRKFARVVATP